MKPVEYLHSRSLPVLALVEAARIVFGRGKVPVKRVRRGRKVDSRQLKLLAIEREAK